MQVLVYWFRSNHFPAASSFVTIQRPPEQLIPRTDLLCVCILSHDSAPGRVSKRAFFVSHNEAYRTRWLLHATEQTTGMSITKHTVCERCGRRPNARRTIILKNKSPRAKPRCKRRSWPASVQKILLRTHVHFARPRSQRLFYSCLQEST